MGGRKGYTLNKIVGNIHNIKNEKRSLLEAIDKNNVKEVVAVSAKILAKSDAVLESLAHSYLFVGSLGKKDYANLINKDIKSRRVEISKRWTKYRKDKGTSFDSSVNRDIVDTAVKILGAKR